MKFLYSLSVVLLLSSCATTSIDQREVIPELFDTELKKGKSLFFPITLTHIAILLPLAFTNAIFVDAERDGEKWLKEWKEEQSRYKLVRNRLKTKNLVMWNPNKEA